MVAFCVAITLKSEELIISTMPRNSEKSGCGYYCGCVTLPGPGTAEYQLDAGRIKEQLANRSLNVQAPPGSSLNTSVKP